MQSSELPPLQVLRAMVAVANARSFTKAANELGLTQTAVSHQIAQLERWLGVRLFIRNRARIELTDEGERAIPALAAALAGLQQAVEAARPVTKGQALRISTTPEFATQWLAPRLGAFSAEHPEIDVSLTIEYRRARFDVEKIGVAIWLAGALEQSGTYQLTEDYELVVCSPAIARTLPKRHALRAAPLLHYEGARHTVLDWERWYGQIYDGMERLSRAEGSDEPFDFSVGPIFPTFSDMIAACRQDAGLALVRTSLVADDVAAGRLVRAFVETTRSDLQYQLVTSPSQRRRSDTIAFRDWILREMKSSAAN